MWMRRFVGVHGISQAKVLDNLVIKQIRRFISWRLRLGVLAVCLPFYVIHFKYGLYLEENLTSEAKHLIVSLYCSKGFLEASLHIFIPIYAL